MDFKIGSTYRGTNSRDEEILIKITGIKGTTYTFEPVKGDCDGATAFWNKSTMAESLELIPDLPRICEVLGVEVGEIFSAGSYTNVYVDADGHVKSEGGYEMGNQSQLENVINGKEKIIRTPQFSEDEKATMREFVKSGYPILRRTNGFGLQAEDKNGLYFPIPDIFPQITFENSPFNAAEYLEACHD